MPKPRTKRARHKVDQARATDALAAMHLVAVDVKNPHDIDGGNITVLASTRDDILRRLHASKGIDDAQFAAGRAWEADWQKAGVGHTSSGGQWRERVQGGGVSQEDLTDKKKNAIDRLGDADKALGIQGCAIVRSFLGDGMNTSGVAIRFMGNSSQRSIDYVNRRFRECLETLVGVYQLGSVK